MFRSATSSKPQLRLQWEQTVRNADKAVGFPPRHTHHVVKSPGMEGCPFATSRLAVNGNLATLYGEGMIPNTSTPPLYTRPHASTAP